MGIVAENIRKILEDIPDHVKLIPISKTMPEEKILEAWSEGYKVFGENKVQELIRKQETLPQDIEWHMVGHVQTNKVKYIAPFVHLIHGVDNFKLIRVINKEADKAGRILNCLFQMHIATEETKFGFDQDEVLAIINSNEFYELNNIRIRGVMGMATFTRDDKQIRREFRNLYHFFNKLKNEYFSDEFKEVSMGMSGDYKIAIEEGSTMIRVGSLIFGERHYHN
jgi:pyridoxal phosphate enzyme (YggS family)